MVEYIEMTESLFGKDITWDQETKQIFGIEDDEEDNPHIVVPFTPTLAIAYPQSYFEKDHDEESNQEANAKDLENQYETFDDYKSPKGKRLTDFDIPESYLYEAIESPTSYGLSSNWKTQLFQLPTFPSSNGPIKDSQVVANVPQFHSNDTTCNETNSKVNKCKGKMTPVIMAQQSGESNALVPILELGSKLVLPVVHFTKRPKLKNAKLVVGYHPEQGQLICHHYDANFAQDFEFSSQQRLPFSDFTGCPLSNLQGKTTNEDYARFEMAAKQNTNMCGMVNLYSSRGALKVVYMTMSPLGPDDRGEFQFLMVISHLRTRELTRTKTQFKERFMGKNYAPVRPLRRRRTTTRKERSKNIQNNNINFSPDNFEGSFKRCKMLPAQDDCNTFQHGFNTSQDAPHINAATSQYGFNISQDSYNTSQQGLRISQNSDNISQHGFNTSQNSYNISQHGFNTSQDSYNISQHDCNTFSTPQTTHHLSQSDTYQSEVGSVQQLLGSSSFATMVDDFIMPKGDTTPWWETDYNEASPALLHTSNFMKTCGNYQLETVAPVENGVTYNVKQVSNTSTASCSDYDEVQFRSQNSCSGQFDVDDLLEKQMIEAMSVGFISQSSL